RQGRGDPIAFHQADESVGRHAAGELLLGKTAGDACGLEPGPERGHYPLLLFTQNKPIAHTILTGIRTRVRFGALSSLRVHLVRGLDMKRIAFRIAVFATLAASWVAATAEVWPGWRHA